MILLFVLQAWSHGGEDHATPSVAPASSADAVSVAATSGTFEAVVRVPRAGGAPTVLLADFATSAPIPEGTLSLTLSGPSQAQIALTSRGPGVWTGNTPIGVGTWSGALVVSAGDRNDLLAVDGLTVPAPEPEATGDAPPPYYAAGVCLFVAGAAIGLLVGRRRRAAVAAILLAGFGIREVSAHGGEDHGAPSAAPTPGAALSLPMESQFLLELRTARVAHDAFQGAVQAIGRFVARPGGSATLRAPVAGILRAPSGAFPVPGRSVRAGDTLATLTETAAAGERASYAQGRFEATAGVADAEQAVALARRDAERAAALGDALSERERLERQSALVAAESRLRAARAAASSLDADGTVVRAPIGGRLSEVTARPGDQVEAGAALFRIVNSEAVWVEVGVPESQAARVLPGSAAIVRTAAVEGSFAATVLDAGQEVDPRSGLVTVTLALAEAPAALKPGMSATAWIGAGPLRDALVVPDAAVVESGGESLVFVKTGPESFEARPVHLGERSGETWEIPVGVRRGERVVVQGTYALKSLAGR